MAASVYIDTSIPSYYVDTRPSLEAHIKRTREWGDEEWDYYDVFTSLFVMRELREDSFPFQDRALQLIQRASVLAVAPEIQDIVKEYLDNYLMPVSDDREAYHLAFASFYEIDYLLTWNCAHLANHNKRQHIAKNNQQLGLFVPIITTPLELLPPEGV